MADPLRLACFGFSNKGREMLRMALQGPGKNIAILCDEASAEAAIFNMDSPNGHKTLMEKLHRTPGCPAIVMGIEDPGIGNTIYVPKPVRISEMIQAIGQCRKNAAPVPSKKAQDKPEKHENGAQPGERESTDGQAGKTLFEGYTHQKPVHDHKNRNHKEACFFNPHAYIQGLLFHALEESLIRQTAMQLDLLSGGDAWQSIVFFPEERRVCYSMSRDRLAQLCATPLYLIRHSLHKRKDREMRFTLTGPGTQDGGDSFEAFRMKVALWTSEGRVPAGTDLSSPVALKRWPNLTRLPAIPNAMRISALLIDQPRPLPLVAKVLRLPEQEVFAFYCAVLALGLAASSDGTGHAGNMLSGRKRHRHHSLFGNILKHLRGNPS